VSLVTLRELGCKVHGGLGHGRGAALTARRKLTMGVVAHGAQHEVGHFGVAWVRREEGSLRKRCVRILRSEAVQSGGVISPKSCLPRRTEAHELCMHMCMHMHMHM